MARTALDMSMEELLSYRPLKQLHERPASERHEQAWEVARKVASMLRERFGATRIVAFGSLIHASWFGPWSDIDLAAWSIAPDQFYRAVAAASGFSSDFEVDLIDPRSCRVSLRNVIEREGIDL